MNDRTTCSPARSAIASQAELGAVVAAQHGWVAAGQCEAVQFVDQGVGGDAALDQAGEALSGVFADDRYQLDDPERAVTGLSTELNMPSTTCSPRRSCSLARTTKSSQLSANVSNAGESTAW